jgi:hypothetical protein
MGVDAVDELALYRVMTTLARRLRADFDPSGRRGDGHD